jgi:hypothetical protein
MQAPALPVEERLLAAKHLVQEMARLEEMVEQMALRSAPSMGARKADWTVPWLGALTAEVTAVLMEDQMAASMAVHSAGSMPWVYSIACNHTPLWCRAAASRRPSRSCIDARFSRSSGPVLSPPVRYNLQRTR